MPNFHFVLSSLDSSSLPTLDFRPAGGGIYASKPRGKCEWMLICNIATVIRVNGDTLDLGEYEIVRKLRKGHSRKFIYKILNV